MIKKGSESAIIIQRAWIKCRYNPKYEMCAKVQDRNMITIFEKIKLNYCLYK